MEIEDFKRLVKKVNRIERGINDLLETKKKTCKKLAEKLKDRFEDELLEIEDAKFVKAEAWQDYENPTWIKARLVVGFPEPREMTEENVESIMDYKFEKWDKVDEVMEDFREKAGEGIRKGTTYRFFRGAKRGR